MLCCTVKCYTYCNWTHSRSKRTLKAAHFCGKCFFFWNPSSIVLVLVYNTWRRFPCDKQPDVVDIVRYDVTTLCVDSCGALHAGREHRSDVGTSVKISHRKHKHEKCCRCSLQVLATATTTGGKVCVNKNNCPLCSIHQSMSVALNLRITSLPSLADWNTIVC